MQRLLVCAALVAASLRAQVIEQVSGPCGFANQADGRLVVQDGAFYFETLNIVTETAALPNVSSQIGVQQPPLSAVLIIGLGPAPFEPDWRCRFLLGFESACLPLRVPTLLSITQNSRTYETPFLGATYRPALVPTGGLPPGYKVVHLGPIAAPPGTVLTMQVVSLNQSVSFDNSATDQFGLPEGYGFLAATPVYQVTF
jgi:hypothetical protein